MDYVLRLALMAADSANAIVRAVRIRAEREPWILVAEPRGDHDDPHPVEVQQRTLPPGGTAGKPRSV